MNGSGQDDTHRAIERVARESYGRLVAYLSSQTRDVASAEDALSNALVAALEAWPRDGLPQNPEAWLLTAARRSFIVSTAVLEQYDETPYAVRSRLGFVLK